nr:hypothetical protein BaRGS_016716 [Batillaria attramentaria]
MALSYPLIGRTDGVNPDHSTRKPIYADRRAWDFSRSKTEYVDKSPFSRDFDEATVTSGVGSSASSSGDEEFRGPESTPTGAHPESPKKRRKLDILQLCEHLKTHGLGEPVMSTSSHVPSTEKLPPGVKARRLPRDPSTREKIKGRARLDYELANLRAEAFCEQQHPRTFRTASANLRNRDMRLLEEEEREQVQKAMHENGENVVDEQDDDASSLVGSPLSREELFCRIEAWADDVDRALHRGHS